MLVVSWQVALVGSQKLPSPHSLLSSTLPSQAPPERTASTQCPSAPGPGASQASPSSHTETDPDGSGQLAPFGKISTATHTFLTHSAVAAPAGRWQVAAMPQGRPASLEPSITRHWV